jgi:hypothetical protein
MKWFILGLLISTAHAAVSDEVIIKGKIRADFDKEKVKITDSLGQTYYLKTKYFPKDFAFKQGKEFMIEVPEEAVEDLKLLKK